MHKLRVRRFVNYRDLCLYMSHLAHVYDRGGLNALELVKPPRFGVKRRYYLAYVDYIRNREADESTVELKGYRGRYILDHYVRDCYLESKDNRILIDEFNHMIPEFYNYGFIFTEVQTSVQMFTKGDENYKAGF